jgi:uncharacterized protein YcfJ
VAALSEEEFMNKSMLMGLVGGIGVATAGGVLGYQFLGQQGAETAAVTDEAAGNVAAAAASAQAARPAAAEECWDEEVQVTAAPKDEHRIAGTAIGAVVGGAIGKDVGDRDLTTAAGAAAGAFIGRKIQGEVQENRADTRTTTTIERRCGPAGSAPR